MNKLHITIAGSGKSTLSRLLTEHLIGAGFCVDNADLDELFLPVDNDTQAKRLCRLLDKDTKIVINSEQALISGSFKIERMDGTIIDDDNI